MNATLLAQTEKSRTTGDLVGFAGTRHKTKFRMMERSRLRQTVTILGAVFTAALGAVYATVLLVGAFEHFINREETAAETTFLLPAMVVTALALITEMMRLPLIATLTWTAVWAKQPIPVKRKRRLNAALVVTFVPSSEDIDILRNVLVAAKQIKHENGRFAIFVLNEGNAKAPTPPTEPTAVEIMIEQVNHAYEGHDIFHITRQGVRKYQQKKGRFAAKTKYGNINSGVDVIQRNPDVYGRFDVVMGVDPDHVPMEEFSDRMNGYFSDPDVAYVVGPQAYANVHSSVARLAESQQFVFHSLIQTAANMNGGPMMVGTSYAIRMTVFNQIGGIQPSITEDMATSFAVLPKKNRITGKRWKGVYTPDLLAHGEGPDTWGAFYKQQDRWSRGAIEYVFAGPFFIKLLGMWRHPLRISHYFMLMSFYPIMALTWLMAAVNTTVLVAFGESVALVDPTSWLLLYGWAAVAQISLYAWARRFNVSPYETSLSWGIGGMFMSVASAPIYAAALVQTILRRPVGFNVTPKGAQGNQDTLFTFRLNIAWAAFYAAMVGIGLYMGTLALVMIIWPCIAAGLSLSPIALWLWEKKRSTVKSADNQMEPATQIA